MAELANLTQMFSRTCRKYPDRVALVHGERKLTYRQLESRVEEVSRNLTSFYETRGRPVGILLKNSPEYVVSYFAILLAGSHVVPFNIMLKEEEIRYIASDSNSKLIITSSEFLPVAGKLPGTVDSLKSLLLVDRGEEAVTATEDGGRLGEVMSLENCAASLKPKASESARAGEEVDGDDLACIMYTSGTTGKPKGAMLTHRNLVSNISSVRKAFEKELPDVVLCVLPMFHAFAATACVLFPLSLGGTIVIVERFSPLAILGEISRNRVSMFAGVPPMYAVLAQTEIPQNFDLSSWKIAVSGGAALPINVMKAFEAKFGVPIYEGDGPTECSPVTAVNPVGGVRKPGSIGKPIPGVEMKIVDEEGRELPDGEIGEIAVKGPNVMKGYLNQPEATKEVLKDGWFHTGDIGKRDEEGYFYILDRKKDLVIIAGLNVYPREVEEVLHSHPDILEASVIGIADSGLKGEALKAFIVPKEGCRMVRDNVISYCRKKLAEYKVPKIVEFRESLPKSPTGKVLKRVLR